MQTDDRNKSKFEISTDGMEKCLISNYLLINSPPFFSVDYYYNTPCSLSFDAVITRRGDIDRYQELQALTNRKPSQGYCVFLGPGLCVYYARLCVYTRIATILGDACTHWLSGPEDFFNISPRRCSLHLQTRIVYLSGLTLVTNCGPSPRAGVEGRGSREGCTSDDEGEKNCVDQRSWRRNKIHGTTRVHATWFARCYEIIPLLLPRLFSLSFYLSLSLASCSTADLPATGFCLPALLSSFERKKNAWNSVVRAKRFNRDFFDLSSLRTLGTVLQLCICMYSSYIVPV